MGNSSQKLDALLGKNLCKESDLDEYKTIKQDNLDIIGNPKLVKSQISGLELEEYEVTANPNMTILQEINLYKLRSSSYSKNIAVVFYHKLLDEESKRFQVRIEKMVCRLNQIVGLTCIESLIILQQTLSGFIQIIQHSKVCFKVTDQMIGINEAGQLRVWGNQNFAVNGIQVNQVLPNEVQMLNTIQETIKKHIDQDHIKNFEDCLKNLKKYQKLGEFKNFLLPMISTFNKKQVLFQITEKMKKKEQEDSILTKSKSYEDTLNIQKQKIDLEQEEFQKMENQNIKYERFSKKDVYKTEKSNFVYSVKEHKKILKNSPKNEEIKVEKQVSMQNEEKNKYKNIYMQGIGRKRSEDLCAQFFVKSPTNQVKNPLPEILHKSQAAVKDPKTFQSFQKESERLALHYPHQKSYPNQQNLIKYSKTEQIRKQPQIPSNHPINIQTQPQYNITNPNLRIYQHSHSQRYFPSANLQKYPEYQQRPASFFKDQPLLSNTSNSVGQKSPKSELPLQKSLVSRSVIISRPKINFSNPSEVQLFYGNEKKKGVMDKVEEGDYQMKSQGFRKVNQLRFSKVETISPSSTAHN